MERSCLWLGTPTYTLYSAHWLSSAECNVECYKIGVYSFPLSHRWGRSARLALHVRPSPSRPSAPLTSPAVFFPYIFFFNSWELADSICICETGVIQGVLTWHAWSPTTYGGHLWSQFPESGAKGSLGWGNTQMYICDIWQIHFYCKGNKIYRTYSTKIFTTELR